MEDFEVRCDGCDLSFPRSLKVFEYVVNAHTWNFKLMNEFCPACGTVERERRTYGLVEEWALTGFTQAMERHFGESVEVVWLQGDEHKWLFHVARKADVPRLT